VLHADARRRRRAYRRLRSALFRLLRRLRPVAALAEGGASRIDYVPAMRIVHHGGNAAQKCAHIRMFHRGAFRFFDKHGWKFA
jgi:hypothetical protein